MTALLIENEPRTRQAPPRAQFGRMTPVLVVERIEPCLEFWVDCLGFEVRIPVPDEDGLAFALVARDDVQLMLRTRSSLERGTPGLFVETGIAPGVVLSLPVDDLEDLLPRFEDGVDVVVPLRETDFGGREIYVREPSGCVLALIERP